MEDMLESTLVDKAVQQDNSSRLKALVARFEKAIQAHDARLAASSGPVRPLLLPFLKFLVPLAKPRVAPRPYGPSSWQVPAPSKISIPAFPILYALARNAPALRHEHTAALPL
jgi:hypothetical protein